MKRYFFCAILALTCLTIAQAGDPIIRIYPQDKGAWQALRNLPLDDVGRGREYIDIVATPTQQEAIRALNCRTSIIADDIEALEHQVTARKGYYHTFAGIRAVLDSIVAAHPAIARLDSIGCTWQGRPILCLTLSQGVNDTSQHKPQILYMGQHHAREYIGMEVVLSLAKYLASGYGADTAVTNLVNNRWLYLVPCVNPDGHVYCYEQGIDWRKNRRDNGDGTYGVDLNRNYDGSQNGDPAGNWGGAGTTTVTSDETYCGPAAFSEPETQAIRDFCLAHRLAMSMSYHSYSECVMWPWGHTNDLAPDGGILSQLGTQMAALITTESGSGTYDPYQSAGMYFTTGDSDDWIYGYAKYHTSHVTLAYTTEVGSEFAPPASAIDQICAQNTEACILLGQAAATPYAYVVPGVPVLSGDSASTGAIALSWTPANADAGIDRYELHELSNPLRLTDNAEGGLANWAASRFTVSTARSHSATHSFRADSSDNLDASLRSATPLTVQSGDSLSYWRWVSTESGYDTFSVEVSANSGSSWNPLEALSGTATASWNRKAFSLASYLGQQVIFRFRYRTDAGVLKGGVYIDDIAPVAGFARDSLVTDSTNAQSYSAATHPTGIFYFKVRAHNAQGWGAWSNLQKVSVVNGAAGEPAGAAPGYGCTLNAAYPSPAQGAVTIGYQLRQPGRVSLAIYNSAGQLVRTLDNSYRGAGFYAVHWDGRDGHGARVTAGVYLCRLNAGASARTNKLVVVR